MPLTSIAQAKTQYLNSLPWQASVNSAQQALDALRYLTAFRARHLMDAGCTLEYETLLTERSNIERFLGATAPRSFGRSRRNSAAFCGGGIQ